MFQFIGSLAIFGKYASTKLISNESSFNASFIVLKLRQKMNEMVAVLVTYKFPVIYEKLRMGILKNYTSVTRSLVDLFSFWS